MNSFIKEACVENLSQAIMAEKKGANRLELCSNLEVGGLTPTEELIVEIVKETNIPVRVMIRPRAGGFVYSEDEIAQMKASIGLCKNAGVEGVVFGALKNNNSLDLQAIFELISLAQPLKVVIHKAIDETPNLFNSVHELVKMGGVDTILTSGGCATAAEGKEILKEVLKICEGRIQLMPAGKITNDNLHWLHKFIGATAYHGKKIVGDLS